MSGWTSPANAASIGGVPERAAADVALLEELQRSRRMLAAAQQLACIGSWEWDVAAGVVTWSDELFRI
jgi:hypothetical protein